MMPETVSSNRPTPITSARSGSWMLPLPCSASLPEIVRLPPLKAKCRSFRSTRANCSAVAMPISTSTAANAAGTIHRPGRSQNSRLTKVNQGRV